MRIRNQLAAIAAVAMLGSLAACGGGDDDKAAEQPAATDTSTGTGTTPAAGTDAKPAAGGATITMTDNVFTPAKLTVAPGAKITVVNKGAARHNLTDKKEVDSGDVNGGETGAVTAPSAAGEYPYKCTYHFGMEGVLTVK